MASEREGGGFSGMRALDDAVVQSLLRSNLWKDKETEMTDMKQNLPASPVEKPVPPDAKTFDLVPPEEFQIGSMRLIDAIRRRKSHRDFTQSPLSLEELSFLLWATQGVREAKLDKGMTLRTVPSGGGRHPFETYLGVRNVDGLAPGVYRYLALSHRLCLVDADAARLKRLSSACAKFAESSAAVFVWTAIPHRSAWRFGARAPKVVALDAGHVCQSLYLACAAIGAGTCAVASYDQMAIDAALGVDGKEEFAIYAAPVGKVAE